MSATLYNTEILRLAASIPHHERLADPMGTSERRSPICGSRVAVDINMDDEGKVREVGLLVRACALGQASSSLLAAAVTGRHVEDLAAARDALTAWLSGNGEQPDWPGIGVLAPAIDYPARHPSIRLAFEAAAEAAELAAGRGNVA